jgi:hypothetical protein
MNQPRLKARTAWQIGPISLARYFAYQLGVRTGLNPVRRLQAAVPSVPFFHPPDESDADLRPTPYWTDTARYFGWFERPLNGRPPRWHENPFNGAVVANPSRPWWQIPDFDPALGDIKVIWEPSRFDWAPAHACQARAGDETAVTRLNDWLTDWLTHNPPYFGPNWKCGQETSIRVMHLAMAALLLKQTASPPAGLVDLIRLHLQRIAPTIQYALAQNNNHGSSEAAALTVGGSWLYRLTGEPQAAKWERDGRRWLEDRVKTLIAKDGSFSQHAVNYHRLLLDSLSMVELWRLRLDAPQFSDRFLARCQAAVHWLYAFTDPATGAAPNIGANDGARLLPLDSTGYQDYRPTVQLAAALFCGRTAYQPGPWDERLHWLGVDRPEQILPEPASQLFDEGGYALLSNERARVFIRYPRYRFRPGHADALHVDFWLDHENLLRDAGSYSYAAEPQWQTYFRSCAGHNTVEFDGRDQMPRLGRFLYGEWLKTDKCQFFSKEIETGFTASYRDWLGARHQRQACLQAGALLITDHLSGFHEKAILRWRLAPGEWRQTDAGWTNDKITITITADAPISRQQIVEGWESRYYLQCKSLPVLEVEIRQPGRFETTIRWF